MLVVIQLLVQFRYTSIFEIFGAVIIGPETEEDTEAWVAELVYVVTERGVNMKLFSGCLS